MHILEILVEKGGCHCRIGVSGWMALSALWLSIQLQEALTVPQARKRERERQRERERKKLIRK